MAVEEIAELQQSKKLVEEISAAKVRQPSMIAGDSEVSRRSSHPETYLTKSEVRLRVAKAEWKTDKQSPPEHPGDLEMRRIQVLGPAATGAEVCSGRGEFLPYRLRSKRQALLGDAQKPAVDHDVAAERIAAQQLPPQNLAQSVRKHLRQRVKPAVLAL